MTTGDVSALPVQLTDPNLPPGATPTDFDDPLDFFVRFMQVRGIDYTELRQVIDMQESDPFGALAKIQQLMPELSPLVTALSSGNEQAAYDAFNQLQTDYLDEFPELGNLTPELVQSWTDPTTWLSQTDLMYIQDRLAQGADPWAVLEGLRPLDQPAQGEPNVPFQPTQYQLDARAYIDSVLGLYDLGGLSEWAWDQIVNGSSAEMLIQSMRQQQAYKDRFSGMAVRQEKGLPAISEGEYISYERQAYQLMRDAGMPEGFWDQRSDFATLIGNDLSINELNQRIANGYTRVKRAPQEVRDAFSFFYGAAGDGALASMFLDPDRAGQTLQQMASAAESGGYGRTFGFDISQNLAESMAARGVTADQARQGFQQLDVERGYYDETITEGLDLSGSFEGTEAQFALGDESAAKVRRRKEERASQFAGSAGGGTATPQGAVGLGSASR